MQTLHSRSSRALSFLSVVGSSLALSLLAACGASESSDAPPTTGTLPLEEFTVISGEETLTVTGDAITGTGTLIYPEPLTDEEVNHTLTFTLEDSGSIQWVVFSEAELANGLEVRFDRAAETLSASLLLGNALETAATNLSGISASEEQILSIDLHNGESPAHVLIFPGTLTGMVEEGDALFNSEEDGDAPGVGSGSFFGVRLENASLLKVVGASVKLSH